MAYSSIVKKKCKCGCEKYPTISFDGYYYAHAPQEIKDRQGLKAKRGYQNKLNKAKANNLSNKVKSFAKGGDAFRDGGKSKSELLKEADRLFSIFIRNRDADKFGNIVCVCCGKVYNLEDKDANGDKVVQCLHFVKRAIYLLRYEPDQCAAGCTWCNKDMHDNPTGKAYQQFKERLIAYLGEAEVAEMEVAHRKINRIETVMLKNIIDHYS